MGIGESNTDDWSSIAELIRGAPNNDNTYEENDAIRAAISLCQRMAKGELVERSELEKRFTREQMREEAYAAWYDGRAAQAKADAEAGGKQPAPGWEYDEHGNLPAPEPAPVCPTSERSEQDEREQRHCINALLRLGLQFDADMDAGSDEFKAATDLLLSERAAVRAERAGLEAELETARAANAACEAKLKSVTDALDVSKAETEQEVLNRDLWKRLATNKSADLHTANAEIERLKARVRELETELAPGPRCWHCGSKQHATSECCDK